jgi:hypothetical protein
VAHPVPAAHREVAVADRQEATIISESSFLQRFLSTLLQGIVGLSPPSLMPHIRIKTFL